MPECRSVSMPRAGCRRRALLRWRYLPAQALMLAVLLTGHGGSVTHAAGGYRQHWRFPEEVLRIPDGLPVGTVVAAWSVRLPVGPVSADSGEALSLREGHMPWHRRWLVAPTSVPGLMLRVVCGDDGGVQDALRMELITSGQVQAGRLDDVSGPLWWALTQTEEEHRARLPGAGRLDYTGRLKVETGQPE